VCSEITVQSLPIKNVEPIPKRTTFFKSGGIYILNAPNFRKSIAFLEASQDSSICSGTSTL
jgi:hypothetical protein